MLFKDQRGTSRPAANPWGLLKTFILLSFFSLSFIGRLHYLPAPAVITELRLNEGTGTTTADASGNAHNGTLTNGPTWGAGKYGQGINLDGSNDYINLADHADYTLTPTVSYTWSAWVRNNNFNQWSTIWSQTLSTSSFFYFYAHSSGDAEAGPVTNGVSVYWYSGSSKLVLHSNNNVLSTGTWSYVTVTYDASLAQASRFTIYVNGADVTNRSDIVSSGTLAAIDPTNIRIGSNQPYGEYLNGSVDEVRYYRRLLSVSEIQTDMNAANSPLPDTQAPTVNITAPAAGNVSGTINVNANAADDVGVAGVQFLLDGNNLGAEDVTAPYSVSWNTTTASSGNHTLTARARDAAGNTTTSSAVIVNVNNDVTAPAINITAPAAGNVSGTINVTADATDNVGVAGVQFLLDGNNLGTEDLTNPYSVSWNTTTASAGNHTLTARARDAAGNTTTSAAVIVNVNNNDVTAPTVDITAPVAGNVSGTINVTADATDNVGVAGVQFLLDGNNLGTEDLTNPYSVSWNTTTASAGNHTLTARARDAAGNTTTSAAVIVNVNNNDVTAPTVDITAPAAGNVSGTINVTANATDNVGVTGVQFLVDGNDLGAEDITNPYSVSWNTTTITNGSHTLTARARDAAGNTTTSSTVVVNVNNDVTAPTVNITSPAAGDVAGTINVTANASDNVGVTGVQFLLDGNNLGAEDVTAPYSISWNTTTVSNGSHNISARARDAAGNTTMSVLVVVNINNDVTAPTISVNAPATSPVSGTITVTANAGDNVGVAGVQFLLDGNNLGAEDVTAPYSVSWNTTTATNGNHNITARARDAAGNTTTSATVVFNVGNGGAPAGLVAAYGFNENTGTVTNDNSGNGNTGTLTNGPVWSASGKYGAAILFDGINDFVNINDANSLDLTNGMTIEAWINPSSMTDYKSIICKENGTTLAYALSPNDNASGTTNQRPNTRIRIGTNTTIVTGPTKIANSIWTHIAGTYDGSVLRLFINGTQVASSNVTGNITVTTNPLRIGGSTALVQYFIGLIDEVRIYNRALSQAEIQTDMNTPVAPDNTSPSVNITAPVAGNVSGTINVTANASDNVGVAGVQFLLDGNNLGAEDVTNPYSVSWNTTTASAGNHTLTARARDAAGNTTTSAAVIVNVNNNDVTAPTVNITAPAASNVAGTINVTANATDNVGVVGVQFLLDGNDLGAEDVTNPYSVSWNTTTTSNGSHTLTARARDAAGNTTTSSAVIVNVNNDVTAPTVNITSPAPGDVAGTINVTATAGDNVGVAGVQFLLDGNNLGVEDVTSPYSVSWNTTTISNGSHTLTGRARDAAGNTTTSSAVIVNVNNDVTAPTVNITSPAAGNVSGTFNVTANATDNVGVAGVQFLVDGNNLGAEDVSAPYDISWNTTTISNGSHTLTARARDAAGNTTTSSAVIVNVNNDVTAPTVVVDPPASSPVSGTINVTANAGDNVGVAGVQFLLDGNNLGAEDVTAPYSVSWNTTTATNGNHNITARARDAAGNTTTSATVVFNVGNGGAPAGLVAAYGFNENTGTVTNDNSGNGNTGTLTNGPVWSSSGKYGAAILFDGINDFVNINDANSLDLTNGMTIEAWINPTSMTDYKSIICKENGTTLAYALSPNDNASGTTNQRPNTRIRIGTNTTIVTGPTKIANSIWTHIAGTYDGSVLRLFINGTQVASSNVTGNISVTTNPLRIGGSTALVQYFIGLIDEVRIYNRALSQGEIQTDMNTPVAPDNTSPSVNITAPVAGNVSGTINVTANASDNVGVSGVQFLLDGNNLGAEDVTNPYSVSWNTTTIANGNHTLTARARDAAGNTTTSSAVIVNVNNDLVSPTINITAPPAGTIAGNVDITADANDNVGVVGVQFLLNGNNLGAEDLTAPYSFTWNTTTVTNGSYTLTARARDAAGNVTTSANVVVTVNNPTDTELPVVNITAPSGGNVSGTINVTANANDNVGVTGVQFLIDGNNLGTEDVTAPYSVSWNTTTVINGNHVLSARARDAAGNTALANNVNVTVANTNPIISGISVTLITESSAVINWTTNIPATSQVNYGTSVSYGLFTLVDSALVTSHSQILNSLAPGTLYHYQVLSGNSGGGPSASGDNTFTTASLAATLGTLNTHTVFAYPAGKIVPWTPNPTNGYDTVMDLAWNYLMNIVPNDPSTGKPAYYSRSYINPNTQQMVDWPHNPAGLYGMLIESGVKYYGYSGNANVMQLANAVAIWHLDHGMTTASDNWASVPYSEGQSGSTTYGGAPQDGVGVLEPDKIGELGYGWLQLYKYNGNIRFRDAAIQAANVLSSKIRVGSTTQSPWPFRVNAHTGSVVENYCSNMIGPISLLDGLIAAGLGDTATYRTTRNAAWTWMMSFPMQNNAWAQYFEDVGIQGSYNSNLNQYNAMMVARYLLEHPEYDANWETHVRGLITWVESIFLQAQLGANTIREQQVFNLAMGSHTSRYASVNALLYEKTGDTTARNKAYRSFNWATYMCRNNGITIDGPDINNQWFTDGYGDYIRHFMTGLGAVREWSPANQTHLVRSNSVIKNITYGSNTVSYTTFDAASTEVLHIAFNPITITANGVVLPHRSDLNQPGWTLDVATKTLKIYHTNATQIVINPGSQGGRSIVQQLPITDSITVRPEKIDNVNKSLVVENPADKTKDLVIMPNPTTGNFALNYTAQSKGDAVIRVTGIDGKLVFITNKNVVKGDNIIYMQGNPSWKPGIYIVTVQQGRVIQQGKLIYQ